jgi:hypothetical protein
MIRHHAPFTLCWTLILGLALLPACGPREEKLHRVSGSVTFDGKPIPKGYIRFSPSDDGPMGFANVFDGKFDTAQGSGVRGGTYTVTVGGFDGKQVADAPFGNGLFPEYNTQTELPAEDSTYDLNITRNR